MILAARSQHYLADRIKIRNEKINERFDEESILLGKQIAKLKNRSEGIVTIGECELTR